MEFRALVAALLRRWYVVLVGLVMTGGLIYVAYGAVPPTYTAEGSVLLLPPGASVPEGSNPLLSLGNLDQPASLVVAYLQGDAPQQAFAEAFPDATYAIALDPLSRGPVIQVIVEDPSPDGVMDALDLVITTIPDALTSLQDQVDAPGPARVTSMPLAIDTLPTTDWGTAKRALVGAAALGITLTLVCAIAIDSLALRRRDRRRSTRREQDALKLESANVTLEEPEPDLPPGLVTSDWPENVDRIQLRDFTRAEAPYGAEWPPRPHEEPAMDNESRVPPRA